MILVLFLLIHAQTPPGSNSSDLAYGTSQGVDTLSSPGNYIPGDSAFITRYRIALGWVWFTRVPDSVVNSSSCAHCHNTAAVDTFNWNPSLRDLGAKISGMTFGEFRKILADPLGSDLLIETHTSHIIVSMPPKGVEQGSYMPGYHRYVFTEEQLVELYLYIRTKGQEPLPDPKPFNFRLILLVFSLILSFLAIYDLLLGHRIRRRRYHWIVLLGSLIIIFLVIRRDVLKLGLQAGYAPTQPVKFSHKVHSGKNLINCLYCHSSATHSASAGFPTTGICMNCHTVIREGSRSGESEISRIIRAEEQRYPLEWVRINNLPDHVFFSHELHVSGGALECINCHTGIEAQDLTRQAEALSMAWCLECHQARFVRLNQNAYYKATFSRDGITPFPGDSAAIMELGGWDCMNCHR